MIASDIGGLGVCKGPDPSKASLQVGVASRSSLSFNAARP